jgi:hypothetical protein
MFKYEPTPEMDTVIAKWWAKMRNDGDLPLILGHAHQGLSGLYRVIAPPHTMVYAMDEGYNIWVAAWFEEIMNGAFMSLWLAKEYRNRMDGLRGVLRCMEIGLLAKPCIFGVTKQERIVDEHRRLGYAILGKAPQFWDDEHDAWVMMLTRAAFKQTLIRFRMASPLREEVPIGSG